MLGQKQEPACYKHWSTSSVIAVISLILPCPLSYSLKEYDVNPLAFSPSIFHASLSLETVWQATADWPTREENLNSEPVKKDTFITLNSSTLRFLKTFHFSLLSVWFAPFARACSRSEEQFVVLIQWDTRLPYSSVAEENAICWNVVSPRRKRNLYRIRTLHSQRASVISLGYICHYW